MAALKEPMVLVIWLGESFEGLLHPGARLALKGAGRSLPSFLRTVGT